MSGFGTKRKDIAVQNPSVKMFPVEQEIDEDAKPNPPLEYKPDEVALFTSKWTILGWSVIS